MNNHDSPSSRAVDAYKESSQSADSAPFTIGELAKKFKITLRALRFYESRGLLTPSREGQRRLYGRKEADRLAAIIDAKKLGFTLSEIQEMVVDEGSKQTLQLTHEKCLEQIGYFERKLEEIKEALAELRSRRVKTSDAIWRIKGREFAHCNCDYGCPCQFNALPTHRNCDAVVGIQIDEGHHCTTQLDGLRVVGVFAWPGAIHQGHGEGFFVIDERANATQREALWRIISGQDTEPGATVFQVFSATLEKVHDPIFGKIEFDVDVNARTAQLVVDGVITAHGEPILDPVTGQKHRARFDLPDGFEYSVAEVGRGSSNVSGPMRFELKDSHARFASTHICGTGVIRD